MGITYSFSKTEPSIKSENIFDEYVEVLVEKKTHSVSVIESPKNILVTKDIIKEALGEIMKEDLSITENLVSVKDDVKDDVNIEIVSKQITNEIIEKAIKNVSENKVNIDIYKNKKTNNKKKKNKIKK